MAQVDLACGPFRIVSLMSREAADELGLEPGVSAAGRRQGDDRRRGAGPERARRGDVAGRGRAAGARRRVRARIPRAADRRALHRGAAARRARPAGPPEVHDALRVTARTNLVANALILGFGTPLAWLLATRRFRGRALVVTLVELPLVLPPAVAGIGLLAAFGSGGLLGGAAGGRRHPPAVHRMGRRARGDLRRLAVLRAPGDRGFEGVDPSSSTSRARSAPGRARTFWRVVLPLAAGGLVAGWVLAFARGIGEFGATIIFAGNVRGVTQTLTLGIYEQLELSSTSRWRSAILLVVLSAGVLLAYKVIVQWRSSSASPAGFAASRSTSRLSAARRRSCSRARPAPARRPCCAPSPACGARTRAASRAAARRGSTRRAGSTCPPNAAASAWPPQEQRSSRT